MKRGWFLGMLIVLFSLLHSTSHAQDVERASGILPLALKVEALSPLSNALLPFEENIGPPPFSPRFYVLEVEKYLPGGHGLEIGFGMRRLNDFDAERFNPSFDTARGIKLHLLYKHYLQHENKQTLEGFYLFGGPKILKGRRILFDGEDQFAEVRTVAISLVMGGGYSFVLKNRVIVSLAGGPQIGRQRNRFRGNTIFYRDQISAFDYGNITLAENGNIQESSFWGLTGHFSFSLGWKFGK